MIFQYSKIESTDEKNTIYKKKSMLFLLWNGVFKKNLLIKT